MLFPQVLLIGWITCTYYGCGPQISPKPLKQFQKQRCQKSDINEVQPKFRQCLGVVAHKIWKYLQYVCHITHSCEWLSSMGTLKMQSPHEFWRTYTLKAKTFSMKTNIWHSKCVNCCMISKLCAYKSLSINRIYKDSLKTGQGDVYTCTWEG